MRSKESVFVSAAGCAPRGRVANDFRSEVIVSPYFPRSTVAGVHRARHLAKHLAAAGYAQSRSWRAELACLPALKEGPFPCADDPESGYRDYYGLALLPNAVCAGDPQAIQSPGGTRLSGSLGVG